VEWVGDNFQGPNQTCFDVTNEKQVNGSKHQTTQAQPQPRFTHTAHKTCHVGTRGWQAESGRAEPDQNWQCTPNAQQHDFATQVVANLDVFLVIVRGVVDVIVCFGLEEKMPDLTTGHGDQPSHQCSRHWVNEQQDITKQEGQGTQQVQALIDAAVVVVTVVIPTLFVQSLEDFFHVVCHKESFKKVLTSLYASVVLRFYV